MHKLEIIYGPDNRRRTVVYDKGDWRFADTGEVVPEHLRLKGLRKSSQNKTISRPVRTNNAGDFSERVKQALLNGELVKPK